MKQLPDVKDCIKLGYSRGSIIRYLGQYNNCVFEWRLLRKKQNHSKIK